MKAVVIKTMYIKCELRGELYELLPCRNQKKISGSALVRLLAGLSAICSEAIQLASGGFIIRCKVRN